MYDKNDTEIYNKSLKCHPGILSIEQLLTEYVYR